MKRRVNANPVLIIYILISTLFFGYETYQDQQDKKGGKMLLGVNNWNVGLLDVEIKRNFRLIHELQDAQADNRRLTKALDRLTGQEMPTQE